MHIRREAEYVIALVAAAGSFALARGGFYAPSGILLMITALLLYLAEYAKSRNLADLKGLFSLSWLGGEGIACFKLSRLQTDWELKTWICFFLGWAGFALAYDLFEAHVHGAPEPKTNAPAGHEKKVQTGGQDSPEPQVTARRLLAGIVILAVLALACFAAEAIIVGFVPFFSDLPHAYSYFHVSGVHYFTVSCILIPAITILYLKADPRPKAGILTVLILCNLEAVLIPILIVSRFQLLFAVGFAVVTYVMAQKNLSLKTVLILAAIMIPLYVILTVARNHDVAYLNGIFDMKNEGMPIFITQPYIYIANNYDNFNCMVRDLTAHSWGLKSLFPVFALTGLKFIFPGLVTFPAYLTRPELTTLTYAYDAYYDFGVIGVFVLSAILGLVSAWLTGKAAGDKNPVILLFYGQIAIYLGLSFFTTWFSNATTWFWLALTLMFYLYVGNSRPHRGRRGTGNSRPHRGRKGTGNFRLRRDRSGTGNT